jgi:7-keto-8-aminopelargonate synthetase-like enzyme
VTNFLCSAAGPHTIVNGKEVINFASANYLGLIGHQKLLVSCKEMIPYHFFFFGHWADGGRIYCL